MLETVVTIILAPIALCAIVLLGCVAVGTVKGIKQSFKKNKEH